MLINGNISSNKTDCLVEQYAKLINSGVKPSEILVILQNSSLKNSFINNALKKLTVDVFDKMKVYSFFGLVYNTIMDNWATIENQIPKGKSAILPNLAGLEVSQFLLRDIIKNVKFSGYNSKKSLLHQLFRRYSLIIQNDLSDEDVKWRSEEVLREGFSVDARQALKKLLAETLNYRAFDYLRQGLLFKHLYKTTDAFKDIKYVFVDDADEITPICFNFIEHIAPQLKDVFVAYDSKGTSRSGYLSADRSVIEKLEKLFNQSPIEVASNSQMQVDAETIFSNVLEDEKKPLKNFSHLAPSKRAIMLELACQKVKALIMSGVKPSDISIITPVFDDMLRFCLKEKIQQNLANLVFLSGSEKLIQNPYVLASLNILKLNTELKKDLTEFDLRVILSKILGIPIKYCKEILENFEKSKTIIDYEFELDEYSEKYKKFQKLLQTLNEEEKPLSEQVLTIYKTLIDFYKVEPNQINKFCFFVKQLQDFENVFSNEYIKENRKDIINQIENSIISENPYSALEVEDDDLIIATPQKIIDNQIKTKYQLWLDVSSSEWIKSDTGPLYNAWVFQADWSKDKYTIDDEIELSTQKTARVLRKLVLCAKNSIFTFSSLFDGNGVENYGGIEHYLVKNNVQADLKPNKPIIPREDQKPVLDYKNGKMAISAVPGAGKTFILLALIMKLMNEGVKAENIFVLTYMESAARNFRERIKNTNQENIEIPNISTIHGLALKILKDNANFERLGLSVDFEICDDTQKSNIVKALASKLNLKPKEADDFEKAISILKLSGGDIKKASKDAKIQKFVAFYKEYQQLLSSSNLIDYNDMLISAVKLLETYPDILEYYQNTCHYIIEDEAQDSSSVQQRLLTLLSGKHKNLIRCGDINQSITTTFSNADVEGFKAFIDSSNSVKMDCSQRCCEDVWKLANSLVGWAETNSETKNSFYNIKMKPVEGKNPVSKNAVSLKIFKELNEESNYVLKQIKTILAKNPKATIGVLLKTNLKVSSWLYKINNAGFKSISRSECLEQKAIFKTIFAVLNMVLKPFDNETVANSYETLADMGFYQTRLQVEIRKMETPFVEADVDKINNPHLAQFYWDLNYWLSFSSMPIEELAIKIGLNYYSTEVEKSNVYLISTLIKRIGANNKSLSYIVNNLELLSKKSSLSGFKFFSEEEESEKEFLEGKVQVMTYHKSKGDEFDYVFLPEMSSTELAIDFDSIKVGKNAEFLEEVRAMSENYKKKSELELKKQILTENLKVLYVAITRAKKCLIASVSKNTVSYGKKATQNPNIFFEEIFGGELC